MANSSASCDALLLAQAHYDCDDCGEWCIPHCTMRLSVIALAVVAARWALGAGLFCRVEVGFLFSGLAVTY